MATKKTRRSNIHFKKGDAFDLANDLKDESIDLVITSPPYWGLRLYGQNHNWEILDDWKKESGEKDKNKLLVPSYDWYRKHNGLLGLEPYPEWYISHLFEIINALSTKIKKEGSLWINIGDTYFARWSSIREKGRQGFGNTERIRRRTPMGGYLQEKQLLLIPSRFAIKMQENKWILRNDLIWYKPNSIPRPEKDRLKMTHEHFFHFVKKPTEGRAKYYYDYSVVSNCSDDVIINNSRPGKNGHSATFPEDLISPRIESSCPLNGTILDPFCGTGRALLVAEKLGRKAIGFDISEEFMDE
jgi:site-specific DNA-methyltransferase (cytosine-N4-specific)